jgi:hypothetical protein
VTSTQSTRVRRWLSDACADIGTWFFVRASDLDPGPQGDPCPDCQVPVVLDKDGSCPECNDRFEVKRREEALISSGYDQGYEAAQRAVQGEGSW